MDDLCRWSAAEIYSAAQGRRSVGSRSPRSSAAASLNRQHTNNRSMRRIDIPEPSRALEACDIISSTAEKHRPEAAVLAEGSHRLAGGSAVGVVEAGSISAADLQPSPQDSSPTSVYEQPGTQRSTAHCRRKGSESPCREASSSTGEQAASSSGLEASLGHRGTAPSGESEVSELLESRGHGLTFVLSHCVLKAAEGSSLARRLLIDNVYRTLQHISFNPMSAWTNISTDVLDIQISYHV